MTAFILRRLVQGVLVMLVPVDAVDRLTAGLIAREFRSSWRTLD